MQVNHVADLQRAAVEPAEMDVHVAQFFLRVVDRELGARFREHRAGVTHLAAGLAIERRLVDDDLAFVARLEFTDWRTALQKRGDDAFRGLGVVAEEFGGADLLAQLEPHCLGRSFARARPGGAGISLLLGHCRIEAGAIDADAARAQRVFGEIVGKAERVVETKGDVTGQGCALAHGAGRFVEQFQAALERLAKLAFLELQRFGDQGLRAVQLGEGCAHLGDQNGHEAPHQRVLRAQDMRMAHRAAHDAAQDIAAALVRGQNAVGDQEGRGAQMVADHAMADRMSAVGVLAGGLRGRIDQATEEIGVVVVGFALEDRGHALETHAGVDRGLGQGHAPVLRDLVELHEDVVPELDIAVAVLVGRTGWAALHLVAIVVEDLGTGAARTGIAHRPEIVG